MPNIGFPLPEVGGSRDAYLPLASIPSSGKGGGSLCPWQQEKHIPLFQSLAQFWHYHPGSILWKTNMYKHELLQLPTVGSPK